ncbi:beta/Gamma crystallin domain-containing protein [Pochonia chlamydosporia 170]|uniref:Beta/Gamma crystallin domain-containing protein n=1 Tax=Pochonia chlamydosporia 170 TaxID=1380566 RepID=A0A179FA93_METCM|nr:beta/Gamma crystallin domain-containing protein [Pochonia chlamydosporia 170]OAQ62358.1 beta/Gamma crystallin domain-containing protein [Pochonia chlamydosporia 170]
MSRTLSHVEGIKWNIAASQIFPTSTCIIYPEENFKGKSLGIRSSNCIRLRKPLTNNIHSIKVTLFQEYTLYYEPGCQGAKKLALYNDVEDLEDPLVKAAAKYSPSKSTVKKRKEGQASSTGGTWSQEKQERPQVQNQSQHNNRLTAQNLLGKDKKNEPYNAYPNDVVADREAGRNDTGGWTDSSSPSYFPRSRSLSPSQSSDSSVSPSDPTAIPTTSLSAGSDKHASSRDLSAKRAIVTRNDAANRPLTSDIPTGGEREHQVEVTSKFQQVLQEKVEECEKRLQDKIEACEKEFHEKFQVSKTELQEKVKEHEVELERKEDTYKEELRQMKEECKTAWEFHLDALYRNSDMDQRLEDAGKMVRERDAKIRELGAESASKSKLVESLEAQKKESDLSLSKMQDQFTEIKSLQSQLEEKDHIVDGLNSQLKIESTENESLQSQLEEKDRKMDSLKT